MGFEEFWKAYPRKEGKAACLKKWEAKKLDSLAAMIVAHVTQRATDDKKWRDGYVPMPLTFISQERWTDEYEKVPQKTVSPSSPNSPSPIREPWPQQCIHRATLNLSMLAAVMQVRGQVPIENLREAVRERNRIAAQLREMYGERVPPQEWAEMRLAIRERFVSILTSRGNPMQNAA